MTISYLPRGTGRLAYEVHGAGPLVVLLHGMGVDRGAYRFTVPALVAAGFRVAALDSRGHGASEGNFEAYDDVAQATDALALVDELGGPAVLVGNSMGGGAAVIAAADRPAAVAGLGLICAFVRNPAGNNAALFRLLLTRPWGPAAWRAYLRSAYPTRKPADWADEQRRLRTVLRRSWRGFLRTASTDHTPARDRLARVTAPTLVVMGTKDPDWKDPCAEARWTAEHLHGDLVLVEGAGHYPQAEFPEVVNPALIDFCRRAHARG